MPVFYDPETGRLHSESVGEAGWFVLSLGWVQESWPQALKQACPDWTSPRTAGQPEADLGPHGRGHRAGPGRGAPLRCRLCARAPGSTGLAQAAGAPTVTADELARFLAANDGHVLRPRRERVWCWRSGPERDELWRLDAGDGVADTAVLLPTEDGAGIAVQWERLPRRQDYRLGDPFPLRPTGERYGAFLLMGPADRCRPVPRAALRRPGRDGRRFAPNGTVIAASEDGDGIGGRWWWSRGDLHVALDGAPETSAYPWRAVAAREPWLPGLIRTVSPTAARLSERAMKTPARRLGPLVALIPAAFAAGSVAAIEPETLPQPLTGLAETVAEAAESAGRESGRADGAAEGYPGVTESAGADASPARSRLLRSLSDRVAATASQDTLAAVAVDPAAGVAGNPDDRVVFGCPRTLLTALLAGAAETGDAVSALAIERETLALCRERQEIVTGIVTLEGELRALLAGSRGETAAPAHSAVAPLVKESTPVRVVRHLSPSPAREEPAKADAPPPPAWSWFSIIGTAGDLRAGVSDGSRVWFVREGDRLPGAVTVERIAVRPPGVHVGGADEAALPYRPRPDGAIPAGAIARGEGS